MSSRPAPKVLVAAVAAACASNPAPPQTSALTPVAAACALDFDTLHAIVTRDYAGYEDRMRESSARIASVADSVRTEVRAVTSDSACVASIQRWTGIFREHDHHFQFWQLRTDTARTSGTSPSLDSRRPVIRFVDDSTAVLTLLNFSRGYKPAIDSLVDTNRTRLLRTPYLVVDLRRNPGGADATFRSVMALIYTDPIERDGFDPWVSPASIARARAWLKDPEMDATDRAEIEAAIARFDSTGKPFLVSGRGGEVRYDSVYAMPRAVGVITGRGCASSCEQFVLDAMQSKKVTVFGTENTAGFLDYANIRDVTLPSGKRRLGTATARSRRLPERPLDKTGIAPQVLIPRTESDPIAFVITWLKSRRA